VTLKLIGMALLAAIPTLAFAQSDGSEAFGELAVANTNTAIQSAMTNNVLQELARRPGARSPRALAPVRPDSARGGPANPAGVSLVYTPSLARRRANLAQFVNRIRASTPAGGAQLEQLFATHDVIGMVGQGLAVYGLRTDNVADAYTAWWINSWQAAHGDTRDTDRATAQAVRMQSIAAMNAAPAIRAMTDAQKQEFAETLLVQAVIFDSFVKQYKNSPAQMRALGSAIRQGAMRSGLDLDAMTLTTSGFVPVKR
jgi:hypothetical protein